MCVSMCVCVSVSVCVCVLAFVRARMMCTNMRLLNNNYVCLSVCVQKSKHLLADSHKPVLCCVGMLGAVLAWDARGNRHTRDCTFWEERPVSAKGGGVEGGFNTHVCVSVCVSACVCVCVCVFARSHPCLFVG